MALLDEDVVCANCGEPAAQEVTEPGRNPVTSSKIPVCGTQCAYELGLSDGADEDEEDEEGSEEE